MNIHEALFTGKMSIYLPETESTNNYAMDLISKTNPPEGTCIYTAYQSAGRGQIGRYWHSETGKNILISYILYPKDLKIADQFMLNIIASLAVRDVVDLFCLNVKIKWPNDIYVDDKKIAGILVQSVLRNNTIKATIIGIGLNVNQETFPPEIPNPVSIIQLSAKIKSLDEIRHRLSSQLEYYYMILKTGKYNRLKVRYLQTLFRFGENSTFKTDTNTIISGKIVGIDDQGKLLIQTENDKVLAFGFREIMHLI